MKPSDYLKKGWCQLAPARDAEGRNVLATGNEPVAWCISEAIWKAFGPDECTRSAFHSLCEEVIDHGYLTCWNDQRGRTQAEVVALAEEIERRMGL